MPINVSALSSYGLPVIDAFPLQDQASEVAAASLNQLGTDVSNHCQTAVTLRMQFTGNATLPTLSWYVALWGNNSIYNPTFSRTSQGIVVITYPSTVVDSLGNTQTLNLKDAKAYVSSGTTHGDIIAVVTSANVVTLNMQTFAGAQTDLVGSTISVEVF